MILFFLMNTKQCGKELENIIQYGNTSGYKLNADKT